MVIPLNNPCLGTFHISVFTVLLLAEVSKFIIFWCYTQNPALYKFHKYYRQQHYERQIVTRTTPSVEPVMTMFCGSHSRHCEKATQSICCMRSALPTHVFTHAISSPLILHRCSQVPAHVAMSPCKPIRYLTFHER